MVCCRRFVGEMTGSTSGRSAPHDVGVTVAVNVRLAVGVGETGVSVAH
jgi:hypothetical protein